MTSTVNETSTETAAVASVPGKIIAAWAAHDAQAFAEVFTADGTMILPGLYQKGRENIAAFMGAAFQGPYRGSQVIGSPIDLRFLTEDTAVVITKGGVIPAGETDLPEGATVRATWVVVKQDGEWLLAAYQNSPAGA